MEKIPDLVCFQKKESKEGGEEDRGVAKIWEYIKEGMWCKIGFKFH